jgi:hypothetical protein
LARDQEKEKATNKIDEHEGGGDVEETERECVCICRDRRKMRQNYIHSEIVVFVCIRMGTFDSLLLLSIVLKQIRSVICLMCCHGYVYMHTCMVMFVFQCASRPRMFLVIRKCVPFVRDRARECVCVCVRVCVLLSPFHLSLSLNLDLLISLTSFFFYLVYIYVG